MTGDVFLSATGFAGSCKSYASETVENGEAVRAPAASNLVDTGAETGLGARIRRAHPEHTRKADAEGVRPIILADAKCKWKTSTVFKTPNSAVYFSHGEKNKKELKYLDARRSRRKPVQFNFLNFGGPARATQRRKGQEKGQNRVTDQYPTITLSGGPIRLVFSPPTSTTTLVNTMVGSSNQILSVCAPAARFPKLELFTYAF